jgi:hypothetical protein
MADQLVLPLPREASDCCEAIGKACARLELDALRVLALLADRLLEGQARYGRLDLKTDLRDFRKERAEEIADMLTYSAMAELKAALK